MLVSRCLEFDCVGGIHLAHQRLDIRTLTLEAVRDSGRAILFLLRECGLRRTNARARFRIFKDDFLEVLLFEEILRIVVLMDDGNGVAVDIGRMVDILVLPVSYLDE